MCIIYVCMYVYIYIYLFIYRPTHRYVRAFFFQSKAKNLLTGCWTVSFTRRLSYEINLVNVLTSM